MTKQPPKILTIIKETWFLVLFVGGLIAAWTSLNMRVNAMERQLALYPSQDYFELKFKTVDDKLIELNQKITDHVSEK